MKVVLLAGTFCGVGTTSIAVGLMHNLRRKGLRVQGFKIGPGFAENELFEAATGRMAVNLDPWMVPKDYLLTCVHRYAHECDIAIIDGCEGLYDSRNDSDGEWSTAELAKLLGAPVLLVVDAAPLGHSCAALVKGFEGFDRRLRISGVILNQVTDQQHAELLGTAMQKGGVRASTIGWAPTSTNIMSLVQHCVAGAGSKEAVPASIYVEALGGMVADGIDLNKILEIGSTSKLPKCPDVRSAYPRNATVRFAVAKDAAFSFYYHENFVLLEAAGAELVFFSPLVDEELPKDIVGLYIGGGHPECYTQRLSENQRLANAIRAFATAGGVVYAEGGGLLYLSKSIQVADEAPSNMAGIFPFRTRMELSPQPLSTYIEVELLNNCSIFPAGCRVHGHVCHPSQVVEEIVRSVWSFNESNQQAADYQFSYRLHPRGGGGVPSPEGYSWKNVLASYVHLQFASNPDIVGALIERCGQVDMANVSEQVLRASSIPASMAPGFGNTKVSPGRPISIDMSFKKGSLLREGSADQLITMAGKRFSVDAHHTWQKASPWSSASSSSSDLSAKGKESKQQDATDDFCYEWGKSSDPGFESAGRCTKELRRSMSFDDVALPVKQGNKKIVALSPAAAEMSVVLGLENRIIALTNLCSYPKNIQDGKMLVAKTKFDAAKLDTGRLEMRLKEFWCKKETAFELDEEYLRQEQPGLVLVDQNGDPDEHSVEQIFAARQGSFGGLMPIQPTTILSHNIHRFSEVFDFMYRVGRAAGVLSSAEETIDQLRSRVAKIGSLVSAAPPRERVIVLTGLNPLLVGGFWIPEMVTMAGGEPVGSEPGQSHQRITWEQLQALEPEVLILAASNWEETKQELPQLASLPGWWGLPALKTGQLYACEQVLFTTPGPRLVEGMELLARILHPSIAGNYGKKGMAWSCTLRSGRRCRPCNLSRHFCALL